MVRTIDDLPASELRFHWKSGRLSLDFATTVGERWRRSFERLREPADLERWTRESGVLGGAAPPVSQAELDEARELREAIDRIARPSRDEEPGDRELINASAARPDPAPTLTDGGTLDRDSDVAMAALLSLIARDAIDLLAGPFAERIRECAADDCALLFVDTSRPGTRRWCTTAGCGNRVRTKAYRRRQREAG